MSWIEEPGIVPVAISFSVVDHFESGCRQWFPVAQVEGVKAVQLGEELSLGLSYSNDQEEWIFHRDK